LDIVALIPSFGSLFFTIAAFIAALLVIVTVHEYGHYIIGRVSGIHAEVFSIGFGPVLYSRQDRHGTRWQLALLPFGGYVKFLGDSDAASGKNGGMIAQMSDEERRLTMHGAPLWARAATVAAGPVFNFVFSVIVFGLFFLIQGVSTEVPAVGKVYSLPGQTEQTPESLFEGDRILAINGEETPDNAAFARVIETLEPAPATQYLVERFGEELQVTGPFPFPPRVSGVQPQSAAMDAGLKEGDVILSVNGEPIEAFSQLRDKIGDSGGAPQKLSVWRDGEVLEVNLTPLRRDLPLSEGGFETRWLIGLTGSMAFAPEMRTPGPLEAIQRGAEQTWFIATTSLSGLYHMVTGAISTCNLSGPIGIAEASGAMASQGTASFIWFIAILSTAVGLLNLFPVPVLDGGHLVFHAYEAVAGRPPSDRALRIMMATGLALILSLMAFAVTNDIFCP
jgi:regulator of sigma E protease